MSQLTQIRLQTQQQAINSSLIKSNLLQRAAITPIHNPTLQRCSNGVECPECRQKRLERERTLQRAAVDSAPSNGVPPIVHDVLRSPGQSLDTGTRAFMEPRFGHDFSGVRVHTDARAAEAARAVNALAYTVGRDVVFGTGQYAPGTGEGRRLLAHELTHVVQQDEMVSVPTRISSPEDASEQEASHVASSIALPQKTNALPLTSTPVLQRSDGPSGSPQQKKSPVTPCPSSVWIGKSTHFNFSTLAAERKEKFPTYLSDRTRMDVGPGPDHTGHYMVETLTLVSSGCPKAMYEKIPAKDGKKVEPCSSGKGLKIGQFPEFGGGPTAFIDEHRTGEPISLLEGTNVNKCTVICEQTYSCDGKHPVPGIFLITRKFEADTYITKDGKKVHITTGTVEKTKK